MAAIAQDQWGDEDAAELWRIRADRQPQASAADITKAHKLLHGKEGTVCGDSGDIGADKSEELKQVKVRFLIAQKPSKLRAITGK